MKHLLLSLSLTGLIAAQEAPDHKLEIAEDSLLAKAIAKTLKESELPEGSNVLIQIGPARQNPTPNTPRLDQDPDGKTSIARLSYRGRTGAPASIAQTATRSGNQPNIKLVTLSPTNDALTARAQPRLWWHQSSPSAGGELEFVLSKLSGSGDAIVFRRPIPPMKPGFNVIDLSHKAVNPRGIGLEPNGRYQWTINLRDGRNVSPVYCRLRFQANEDIAKGLDQASSSPDGLPDGATIDALAESGNWHEVLDLAATLAARHPEQTAFAQARTRLLQQAQLSSRIKE